MKVASIDNRGERGTPWGFVWFDDRESVAFRAGADAWHVEHGNPNWPGNAHNGHLDTALAHLNKHGMKVPDDTTA